MVDTARGPGFQLDAAEQPQVTQVSNTKLESISSSSCHRPVVFHLSTQDFAVSLNFKRSFKVQVHTRKVHWSICAVFSVARPHPHVVSPSKYCHFFHCSLLNL